MEINQEFELRILDSLHGGLYFVDKNRKITYWNRAAESITGFSADEVIGKHCRDDILIHIDAEGNKLCTGLCPLAKSINNGIPTENEIYLHHKDGHRIPVSVRTNSLIDKNGQIIGGIELFTDISNHQAYELKIKELEKLAMLDNLTQLPNRNYMHKEFNICFEEKKRLKLNFGVLYIDIDHFKNFNDKYGHNTGDEIIKLVANTFIKNSRPFDIYGRWGGEEFLGLIRNVDIEELQNIGNRIRIMVENSFTMYKNEKLKVTISIGATMVKNKDTINVLINRADNLLYQSKKSGRNCLTID